MKSLEEKLKDPFYQGRFWCSERKELLPYEEWIKDPDTIFMYEYFENTWKPDYTKFGVTGYALVDRIKNTHGEDVSILDVGCGYNLFKKCFTNLYGIDPANDNADEKVDIISYEPKQYDVVLALGSLNFGSYWEVFEQTRAALKCLKPGGTMYWRQNPGIGDHPWKGVENIKFFPWSFETNLEMAAELAAEVTHLEWDGSRIFAIWKKA